MKALLQRVWQRLLRRVGTAGLLGLALIALAAGLFAWTPALLRQAGELHDAAQSRHAALFDALRARAVPPSAQESWQQFNERFPTRAQNVQDLRQIFASARRHAVSLNKGEYQFIVDPASPFVTCAATFPVREGYGDIKQFTADVLRQLPHAAMDELRMERSDAGAAVIDARIRITLTYRAS